jgi:hypothetical protein
MKAVKGYNLWGAVVAFLGATIAGGQTLYILFTGEELCVGGGCALVGQLTRISPLLFNLMGCVLFLVIALLALATRKKNSASLQGALHLLLTAAFGAEGVLFAYQWYVASAWCIYCLIILATIALLNLLLAKRGAIFGAAAFAASLTIFSLLTFIPFNKTLDDGTYAMKAGTNGPEIYLLFSEDCPHCQEVEEVLETLDGCTVRFNPVAQVTRDILPGLEPIEGYDTRVNFATASLLGLDKIPILIAKTDTGREVVTGTSNIIGFVQAKCNGEEPILDFFLGTPPQDAVLIPADDGCGIVLDCD